MAKSAWKPIITTIESFWDSSIVPTLVDYIRIPAKSPHFEISGWAEGPSSGVCSQY